MRVGPGPITNLPRTRRLDEPSGKQRRAWAAELFEVAAAKARIASGIPLDQHGVAARATEAGLVPADLRVSLGRWTVYQRTAGGEDDRGEATAPRQGAQLARVLQSVATQSRDVAADLRGYEDVGATAAATSFLVDQHLIVVRGADRPCRSDCPAHVASSQDIVGSV